ncbi:MAG TPA: lysophospholipid acyltransferase family protein [Gemmatimonadales bacterium]|nr:lysophospholipid acyltransferase family protein [Gemmatimonadales bacterium]
MIRLLWYYAVLVVSSVIHASGTILAALVRVPFKPGGVYDWGTNDWSRQILWGAGTRLDVQGLERIPPGPVVYASNHSSMFDIWALAACLPGSTRFVAKAELGRIPLVGLAMKRAGHIMINRDVKAKAMESYAEAGEKIRSGFSPIVFPEGTRSRTGEMLPFKTTPFALAIAAQVPVVPVYVHNTFAILPKGAWRMRPMPIRIRIGDPVPTTGLALGDRSKLKDQVEAQVRALQARVDSAAPVT